MRRQFEWQFGDTTGSHVRTPIKVTFDNLHHHDDSTQQVEKAVKKSCETTAEEHVTSSASSSVQHAGFSSNVQFDERHHMWVPNEEMKVYTEDVLGRTLEEAAVGLEGQSADEHTMFFIDWLIRRGYGGQWVWTKDLKRLYPKYAGERAGCIRPFGSVVRWLGKLTPSRDRPYLGVTGKRRSKREYLISQGS